MDLDQWIVFVHERDPVPVFLQDFRKQLLVHARAEGAFKVIKVHHHHFGSLGTARGPTAGVDLAHRIRVGVLTQVILDQSHHGRAVLGNEESQVLLTISTVDGHNHGVVLRKLLAWRWTGNEDLQLIRHFVGRPYLTLDL